MGKLNKKKAILKQKALNVLSEKKVTAALKEEVETLKFSKPKHDILLLKKPPKETTRSGSSISVSPKKLLGISKNSKMKKKDKMKLKAELLRKRLNVEAEKIKEAKLRKIREKTVIVGDMKPLTDTLNIIDEDENKKNKGKGKLKKKPPRGTLKQKKRQEEMLKNIDLFNQVVRHPEFVKNPFETISTHIENKMLMEAAMADK